MKNNIKLLAFAGSTRKQSFNKCLAKLAASYLQELGAEAEFIDLKDYPLPLYDGDLESSEAYPANAAKLKKKLQTHDGFLISSPEYNSSISGVLKNTIDWLSRSENGETDLSAFNGKTAALISTSPGHLGGLRGLVHLRSILSNIGMLVIPSQLAINQAATAFNDTEQLSNEKQNKDLKQLLTQFINITEKLCSD